MSLSAWLTHFLWVVVDRLTASLEARLVVRGKPHEGHINRIQQLQRLAPGLMLLHFAANATQDRKKNRMFSCVILILQCVFTLGKGFKDLLQLYTFGKLGKKTKHGGKMII